MSSTLKQQSADGVLIDSDRGIVLRVGTTVPADGTRGYAPGAIFMDQNASQGAQFYINEGSNASCDFNVVALGGLDLSGLLATAAEINRTCDNSTRIVNLTAATLAVTEAAHDKKVITINKADGTTITLPPATGSGMNLFFAVGTTITSNNLIIQVTGDDTMTGGAWLAQDAADTVVMFETASTSDTITMNGSTKGGIKGDSIELIDIAADLWWVRVMGSATGTEATPFSAAV